MRENTPISMMSPRDIDRLIVRYRRALASHHREALTASPTAKGDFVAAFDTCLSMLIEIEPLIPENKRAKVRELIDTYRDDATERVSASGVALHSEADQQELDDFLRSFEAQIEAIKVKAPM